jgi:hypothetical protein
MAQLEIAAPAPSYEAVLRHHRPKSERNAPRTRFSPWVHSRSLRSPGRLARLAWRARAVGRLRAVDYGDNRETLDAS